MKFRKFWTILKNIYLNSIHTLKSKDFTLWLKWKFLLAQISQPADFWAIIFKVITPDFLGFIIKGHLF